MVIEQQMQKQKYFQYCIFKMCHLQSSAALKNNSLSSISSLETNLLMAKTTSSICLQTGIIPSNLEHLVFELCSVTGSLPIQHFCLIWYFKFGIALLFCFNSYFPRRLWCSFCFWCCTHKNISLLKLTKIDPLSYTRMSGRIKPQN